MATLTKQEIERNMRAVDHAIAQQQLEGLEVPEATVADLRRAARGEIDTEEVISNIKRRYQHPYLDQAFGVLKNKLGITDPAELNQAEAALVATRSYQIQQTPLKGDLNLGIPTSDP